MCVCVCVCVCAVLSLTLCDPMDCSSPGSSVHEAFPGKNTVVGCHAIPPGYLPSPGFKLWSPMLQACSLLVESPGEPKNTGVGGLSLLWGNFLTQELNWGLLHFKLILYQLSYPKS